MVRVINQFMTDESGLSAIEYAEIAALISAVIIGCDMIVSRLIL